LLAQKGTHGLPVQSRFDEAVGLEDFFDYRMGRSKEADGASLQGLKVCVMAKRESRKGGKSCDG